MNRLTRLLPVALLLIGEAFAQPLTLERIFASPSLDGTRPRNLTLAPDGSRVTFLRGKDNDQYRLDLWEYHIEDATTRLLVDSAAIVPEEGELSDAEKARRERQRIAQYSGIVDYAWTEDSSGLLFPLGGDVYLYRLADGAARQITRTDAFETDARLSPEGAYVSFIRNQDLHVVDLRTGRERALTSDGDGAISNGVAEFVAQEEMDRDTGYWWSPDDQHIAFLRVDDSPVQVETRYEVYGSEVKAFEQRYPAAGTANAVLQLGVAEVRTGKVRWLDLGDDTDIYIPRVDWLPDGRRLAVQRQSRDQQRLELLVFDTGDGSAGTVLSEQAATWINLHDDLHFLDQSERFIWSSERAGFRHLYLYDLEGKLLRQLTTGAWEVTELEAVDEARGQVYFSATRANPAERHLYRVALDGGEPELLTHRPGTHSVTMPDSASIYVDAYSSRNQPLQVSVHDANGKRLAWLSENALDEQHPYAPFRNQHGETARGTLEAADGQTLHWQLLRPADFDSKQRYPVIVYVYGGPTGQMVRDAWGRRILIEQYWAQQGFLVFTLDNRGVQHYGKAFQAPAYKRLGVIEVEDQLVGVDWLKSQPFVDPERIGVFGWSYGGYMTLMLLTQAPGVFAAGAAVAPVTDWSLYDTHYTERYLGTPQNDADAYRLGNVLTYAERLADPLLLVHGMADDNVLFTNSTVLMERLQRNAIPFELMTYPGGKHGLVGEHTRVHVYGAITRFLSRQLGD
ncbi:MAG: S9 family peptidase [Pseudomonadota bacterium]